MRGLLPNCEESGIHRIGCPESFSRDLCQTVNKIIILLLNLSLLMLGLNIVRNVLPGTNEHNSYPKHYT